MRNRRDAIAIATLLLAFAVIAILLRPHADELDTSDVRATSYRSSPTGARALYLLLEELQLPVERELDPWTARTPAGALVLIAPSETPTDREIDRLLGWVRAGGTLIYAPARADPLRNRLGLRYRALVETPAREDSTVGGVTAMPVAHAWTAGIDSVSGFRRAFVLDQNTSDSITVLLRAAAAPTAITFAWGDGRIVVWSDANPLRNARLREGGAAVLFARAAAAAVADSGVIRFDEFHHGFRAAGPFGALRRFLRDTNAGRAMLQIIIAALALLLLAGARLGAPVPSLRGRRRSPLEHVEAVAAVYRRAQARRTTRQLLMAGLERRLGRRITVADGTIAATALNPSAQAERLREQWQHGIDGDLADLSGAVDDYLTEVRWR